LGICVGVDMVGVPFLRGLLSYGVRVLSDDCGQGLCATRDGDRGARGSAGDVAEGGGGGGERRDQGRGDNAAGAGEGGPDDAEEHDHRHDAGDDRQ
jgi:hypothetical protein